MIQVTSAATYTRILAAICTSIGSAEYLAIKSEFKGSEIFSQDIYRLDRVRVPTFLAGFYSFAFSYPGMVVINGARLFLALTLLLTLDLKFYSLILAMLFSLQLHTFVLSPVGHDGSDQMMLIVTGGLAVAYAFRLVGPCTWVALSFIVAQALLAYLTSGISKLLSPLWRSGRALQLIFNTACYGSPVVNEWFTQWPYLALVGSWGVILFECCVPLSLVVPQKITLVILTSALLFHGACALTMGLNCFLWAFASTFPLIYLFSVNPTFTLSGLRGSPTQNQALFLGGAGAVLIVGVVMLKYYDMIPALMVRLRRSPFTLA